MLRSIRDIGLAYAEGREHVQRFYKTAGLSGDGLWQDWAYQAGHPGVNARVGNSATFTPFTAERNQAIWFPGINPGQERRLAELMVFATAGGTNQATKAFLLYDLLGVYPLLDGDSLDAQDMDNTETLPRYTDGEGVFPVLVNHVAAQFQAGTGIYSYIDSNDVAFTNVPFGVSNVGLAKVGSSSRNSPTVNSLFMPSAGCRGVKQITSLTFTVAPSGLWAIYLIKPLQFIDVSSGDLVTGASSLTHKEMMLRNALHLPRIYDGAHLGFFYMPNGGARTVATIYGHATFIWG